MFSLPNSLTTLTLAHSLSLSLWIRWFSTIFFFFFNIYIALSFDLSNCGGRTLSCCCIGYRYNRVKGEKMGGLVSKGCMYVLYVLFCVAIIGVVVFFFYFTLLCSIATCLLKKEKDLRMYQIAVALAKLGQG